MSRFGNCATTAYSPRRNFRESLYIREGGSHPWHVAIVSDRRDADGMPYVIDSFPPHTSERHRLNAWPPIYRHFRVPATLAQGNAGEAAHENDRR